MKKKMITMLLTLTITLGIGATVLAATYGTTPQEVSKIIKKNHSIGNLVATVLHKKAANFIIDSAVEA